MKKNFILDTNVLLHDPRAIYKFEDNTVVVPISVIEELDNFKHTADERGKSARIVSRKLDEFRAKGKPVPAAVSEIPRFPFATFADLLTAIRCRQVLLQRFSFEYVAPIFRILAAPAEREVGEGVYQNLWGERYIYRATPWGQMREDVFARQMIGVIHQGRDGHRPQRGEDDGAKQNGQQKSVCRK